MTTRRKKSLITSNQRKIKRKKSKYVNKISYKSQKFKVKTKKVKPKLQINQNGVR